jgi:hypothetical protein
MASHATAMTALASGVPVKKRAETKFVQAIYKVQPALAYV